MKSVRVFLALALILVFVEKANAVEFENLGRALMKVLGTKKAYPVAGTKNAYYAKTRSGVKYAVIEKGVYEPNCTHTWVIGIDGKTKKVSQVRVVEMSCPHAFPTKERSFLSQYEGKGPADLKKLSSQIDTKAKATGSSHLTTDAVKRAIKLVKAKGR